MRQKCKKIRKNIDTGFQYMLRGTGVGCRWSNPPPNTDFNTPLTVPKKGVIHRQRLGAMMLPPYRLRVTSHIIAYTHRNPSVWAL